VQDGAAACRHGAATQLATALISSSENPLAMRFIKVPARAPDLNARIASAISPAARPASAGAAPGAAEWQPEQALAPGGAASKSPAFAPPPHTAASSASATPRLMRF